jgi:hypothetical protein
MTELHIINLQNKNDYYHGLSFFQRKITTEIIKLRNLYYMKNNGKFFFDSLSVSSSIFSFISDSSYFTVASGKSNFIGMSVEIDNQLESNSIKLTTKLDIIRSLKLNYLLVDESEPLIFEVLIKVEWDIF